MSFTGIKTLPLLAGTVASASPWQGLFARSGYRVYPFQLGAKVRGTSTGTAVTLYGQGAVAANDYIIFCDATAYGAANMFIPNLNKIRRCTAVSSSDDAITIDSAVSITAGDYMLVIGADTATTPETAPNYDGSTVSLYSDNAGINAVSPKYLSTTTGGSYIGWTGAGTKAVDLLVTNSSGVPQIVDPFVAVVPNEEVNQIRTYTAAGATPSAAGFKVLKVGQSGAQAITNFTGGTTGQILTVIFTDANSTIADSGNFKLNSAVASANEMVLVLVYDGTSWYEVGRNNGSGGGGTATETTITSGTLSGSAANIDLTSISQAYTDLRLELLVKTDQAAIKENIRIAFNADTTDGNYDVSVLYGSADGSAKTKDYIAAASNRNIGAATGSSATANQWGWIAVDIPSYASAKIKLAVTQSALVATTADAESGVERRALRWNSTAAISRITITSVNSANLITGTYYRLSGRA